MRSSARLRFTWVGGRRTRSRSAATRRKVCFVDVEFKIVGASKRGLRVTARCGRLVVEMNTGIVLRDVEVFEGVKDSFVEISQFHIGVHLGLSHVIRA